jgi:hypothetical protein
VTTYIFNEPGSIPGIPGTFANCRVDIDEAGNLLALPLAQHPAMVVAPVSEGTPTEPLIESIATLAESTPTIVQEQVPPGLALNIG